jgi:PadR family transcriptional regulator, regulatory protein PadR
MTTVHAAKLSPWRRWVVLFGEPRRRGPVRPDGVKNSRATRCVLLVLLTGATNLWGLSICRISGLSTGRLYPVLARLEAAGWIEGRWEEGTCRPRRRFYSLTPRGRQEAQKMLGLEMS